MAIPNWAKRTLWTGDNLDIMRGMNSESVDLIYLDPPFNSNKRLCRAYWLRSGRGGVQGHVDPGRCGRSMARRDCRPGPDTVRYH